MWTGSQGPLSDLWLPPPSEQPGPAAGAQRAPRVLLATSPREVAVAAAPEKPAAFPRLVAW